MGAGLDWKTSLQELSAEHGLGVPEYVIEDDGPDHMKTFTAQVRVGEQLYGHGTGRSKKEAEQRPPRRRTGRRRLSRRPTAELPSRAPLTAEPCRSSPRSRSSAPASSAHVVGRTHRRGRGAAPASRAPGPARLRRLRRRADRAHASRPPGAAASTSGCPSTTATPSLGHLGMSGQMLVQPPGRPDERHLRVRFTLTTDDGPLELRFVDQRMFGGLLGLRRAAPSCRPRSPTSRATRSTRSSTRPTFVRRVRRRTARHQAAAARPGAVSGVGNIYADEALWRARLHGERPGDRLTAAQVRELLGHAREVMTEALAQGGTSFDALYVNVNGESGYFDRSLHAYGREGEPCERCGTPIRAGRVHEPVVVLLPDLPAARRAPAGRSRPRRAAVPQVRPVRDRRWDSWRWPENPDRPPPRKGFHGQGADRPHDHRPADPARLASENVASAPAGRRPGGPGAPAPGRERRPGVRWTPRRPSSIRRCPLDVAGDAACLTRHHRRRSGSSRRPVPEDRAGRRHAVATRLTSCEHHRSSRRSSRPSGHAASGGCSRRRGPPTSATASRWPPGRCWSPRRPATRCWSPWRRCSSGCRGCCSACTPARWPTGSTAGCW